LSSYWKQAVCWPATDRSANMTAVRRDFVNGQRMWYKFCCFATMEGVI